jgi:prolyl-tRNA synthetase
MKETLGNAGVRIKIDKREEPSIGRRFNEWEVKGVPVRLELGHKELEADSVVLVRRDTGEKMTVVRKELLVTVQKLLNDIQQSLFDTAKTFLETNTRDAQSWEEFTKIMNTTRGFIRALWCEDPVCEKAMKEKTKACTRCLPLESKEEEGICVHCGKPAHHRWIFGQSY